MKDKFNDTKGLDNAYMSLAKHYDERKENAIRQVKDGAFVDLLNKEMEELQNSMKDKEMINEIKQDFKMHEEQHKQIEEMAYVGCRLQNKPLSCTHCMWKVNCNEYDNARTHFDLGYRKLDEHAIMVLRKAKGMEDKIHKETAREILNKLYNYLPPREKANVEIKKSSLEDVEKVTLQMYKCFKEDIRELAKQHGVEIKE